MALRTAYRQTSTGIRVPYQGQGDGNRGFVDLRGRPELAATTVEAVESAALRRLLVRLAAPGFPLFSLGCDLGSHEEKAAPPQRRFVAGGYVHVLAADFASTAAPAYHRLAQAVEAALAAKVARRTGSSPS